MIQERGWRMSAAEAANPQHYTVEFPVAKWLCLLLRWMTQRSSTLPFQTFCLNARKGMLLYYLALSWTNCYWSDRILARSLFKSLTPSVCRSPRMMV